MMETLGLALLVAPAALLALVLLRRRTPAPKAAETTSAANLE